MTDKNENNLLLNSAEWYANLGWKVIPCHGITDGNRCTCNGSHAEPKDIGKHPVVSWNQAATSDIETIRRWWHTEPKYNLGVVCRPSGFLVIDIDPRSGGDNSYEKFQELVEGNLPLTLEANTGTYTVGSELVRGRHLFYKCDSSEDLIGNLEKSGLRGIDIKHNGYVLIAPSKHYSGTTYQWVDGKRPDQIEMADAPEQLLQFLRKKNRRKRGTSYSAGDWNSIIDELDVKGEKIDIDEVFGKGLVEGERATGIFRIACALANKVGVGTEAQRTAIETTMIRFNAEKINPPMELEGTNSVLMHTRRAIDFVANNPKSNLLWSGGVTFEEQEDLTQWAKNSQEETRNSIKIDKEPQALVGVVTPNNFAPLQTNDGVSTLQKSIEQGVSIEQSMLNRNLNISPDQDALFEEDGGTPGKRSLTDVGNGRRLVDLFKPVIRYTEGLGWFNWTGSHWRPDVERLDIKELAKKLGSIVVAESKQYSEDDQILKTVRWGNDSKSVARINSAIESANSDNRIRIKVDDWDQNPMLLGVANGVVDLKTGKLIKNSPDLYITRTCPVGYIPGQQNVRWKEFLNFATGGDVEYQDYLQRAAGYSVTGLKSYDVLFLVYGPPGSGKNTFVEAIVKALGTKQYAWPFDTSVISLGDGKSNSQQDAYYWAQLRGRRVVWVDELPDSERIKENSLKRLTGSSEITGRSPGEKPFSFQSQAKLWISTNHRPIITDDAMWRRIRPIPFTNVPEKPDPDLKDYIFDTNGGLPAVLSWAVEGAIKLLNSSSTDALGTCRVVSEASTQYQKNEDRIGIFLEEETKPNSEAGIGMDDLYLCYKLWSERRGERGLSQIAFDRKLRDRTMEIIGTGSRALVKGLMLPPRIIGQESIPNLGSSAMRYGI